MQQIYEKNPIGTFCTGKKCPKTSPTMSPPTACGLTLAAGAYRGFASKPAPPPDAFRPHSVSRLRHPVGFNGVRQNRTINSAPLNLRKERRGKRLWLGANVRKAQSFVFAQQPLTETPASETVRMVLGTFCHQKVRYGQKCAAEPRGPKHPDAN